MSLRNRMRVLVVRHHAEDDVGLIGEALEQHGAELRTHLFPGDGALPPAKAFDRVVVLGAKWSIYDAEAVGGWIDRELEWLRQADDAEVPILGICFGAQALTTAFGGRVEKSPAAELGWVTIEPESPGSIASGPWFQFHSDRCLIPPAAQLLASNHAGAQAFTIGRHLGVQFHPEVDAAQLERWMENGCREEIEDAGLDPDRLLAETAAQEPASRQRAAELVRNLLRQVPQ